MQVLQLTKQDSNEQIYIAADKVVSFEKKGTGTLVLVSYGKGLGYEVTLPPEEIHKLLDPENASGPGGGGGGGWG